MLLFTLLMYLIIKLMIRILSLIYLWKKINLWDRFWWKILATYEKHINDYMQLYDTKLLFWGTCVSENLMEKFFKSFLSLIIDVVIYNPSHWYKMIRYFLSL